MWNIRSWKVSYYADGKKSWITGMLTCTATDALFVKDSEHCVNQSKSVTDSTDKEENVDKPKPLVSIKYCDIKRVQKRSSMLVYAAVTVETLDGQLHWFSSLPDRHSVYSMLQHFARQSLLAQSTTQVAVFDPASKTRIGQQLLRSVEDSKRTLAGAASDLWHQGRQLANASITVQDMHEDLDVAERLLSGLNSWLKRWRLPPEYKATEAVQITKDDIPCDHDYEVLFSEMSKSQWHPQQLCILRTAKSGITILDLHQRPLQIVRWVELSRVFVVSPWEVVLTKHVVGRADVSMSVVGAALLPVLQLLQASVPHLVDYQTPPEASFNQVTSGSSSQYHQDRREAGTKLASYKHSLSSSSASAHQLIAGTTVVEKAFSGSHDRAAHTTQENLQAEQSKEQEEVSDAELRALSSHLGGLKMLALSVGEEVTNQNKALDELNNAVDHADSRIQDANHRMKRLM